MAAAAGMEYEILVADNASTDGSRVLLDGRFAHTRFLWLSYNAGFAKANNLLLQQARGKYILFLNPDTWLPPDSLQKCVDFCKDHYCAVGVRMVNGEGRFLPESKRGKPNAFNSFCKLSHLSGLFPNSRALNGYYAVGVGEEETAEVDVLSGAFLLVPKNILQQTGGFDERFFMYAEDIDLCHRIQQAGFKNYYLGSVTIVHYKGASTPRDREYIRHFYGAMSLYVKKHYRGLARWFLLMGIQVRAALATLSLQRQVKKKNH